MADPPSWKNLRAEFQKYADQYADRAEREPPADWAQLPQGPWTIHGGSPRSHRLFKEIAAQAVARRGISCHPGDKEPWQLWLDFLWTEGWHCPDASGSGLGANRPRRVSYHEYRILAEDETQRFQRIFQTSADCCADFEERETDKSEGLASEPPDMNVGVSPEPLKRCDQNIDPASKHEREIDSAVVRDRHVDLLEKIVAKKNISIETWASDHNISRTVLFDWKGAREAGKPLKGKVSDTKSAEIETAIVEDAKALGLVTRTGSD